MTFETGIIPIQIRPDLIIQIAKIPYDLSREEAEKIARVITAFAAAKKGAGDRIADSWKPDGVRRPSQKQKE